MRPFAIRPLLLLLVALASLAPGSAVAARASRGGGGAASTEAAKSGDAQAEAGAEAPARTEAKADAAANAASDDSGEASEGPAATPQEFERALALHHQGDARQGAPLFFGWLARAPKTAEHYQWAQAFLAEDLSRLGFTHAAVVYWADVAKNRVVMELVPEVLASLERTTAQGPYDTALVDREVLYGTDFGFLPPEANDFVQFHKGRLSLADGQLRWAWGHFERLRPGGARAAQARLMRLVHELESGSEKVESALARLEALAGDATAPREVRNDARIAAARLHFERGANDRAHALYDAVDLAELDPGRGQIYLEKAWAYYRAGDASRAMGLLLALDAPSFRELFLPEKYLLAALVYKDRCHYIPAKRAARGFTRRYQPSLRLIRERGPLDSDPRLLQAALEEEPALRRAEDFHALLVAERDRIDDFAGRFEATGLTRHLRQLYDRAVAEAERQRQSLRRAALRGAADRLLRGEEQVRLLDYEIGLALYKRVKAGAAAGVADAASGLAGAGEVGYPFDGEYWNDELKDYRLDLRSRCAEVEADR